MGVLLPDKNWSYQSYAKKVEDDSRIKKTKTLTKHNKKG